jgi:diacylglycerol kinase (ATP)
MERKRYTSGKWMTAFVHAWNGICLFLRHERNATVHGLVALGVVAAGFLLDITAMEWTAVVTVCGCVLSAEALNTAIERLSDIVSPEYSEGIKRVKDLAAGAVLFVALAAAVTGLIIFLPKLFLLFIHLPQFPVEERVFQLVVPVPGCVGA